MGEYGITNFNCITAVVDILLCKKQNNNNNITTLICLAISVHAKVLCDPQYSRGLNWYGNIDELAVSARGGTVMPSKLFANHNALGQLINHNTFLFSEGGPSSNQELIESFVSGWGEGYCNNEKVKKVKVTWYTAKYGDPCSEFVLCV